VRRRRAQQRGEAVVQIPTVLASGRTVREAAALFLSPKAVEYGDGRSPRKVWTRTDVGVSLAGRVLWRE
jgi:hypothetical protein